MMEEHFHYIYVITVSFLYLILYLYSKAYVKKTIKKRVQSVKGRDIEDAVETDSPVKSQSKAIKAKGISGIETRFAFISRIIPSFLLLFWIITLAIPFLGEIPTAYISVVTAIISVVVGISLRPFLENLFSGIVITFFRSVKIGDTVIIDNNYGLIEEIGLTHTVLKRWDWYRIVLPNSTLLNKEVQNLTMHDSYIWAHIEFYVAPDSNLEVVKNIAIEAARNSDYFSDIEEPSFWVIDVQKDTIMCWIAGWSDSPAEAWELRHDMRTNIVTSLQEKGIKFHNFNVLK